MDGTGLATAVLIKAFSKYSLSLSLFFYMQEKSKPTQAVDDSVAVGESSLYWKSLADLEDMMVSPRCNAAIIS